MSTFSLVELYGSQFFGGAESLRYSDVALEAQEAWPALPRVFKSGFNQ